MDDADYAALLASCLPGATALTVIEETDRLLKAEDFQVWNAWVANLWKEAANLP